jgi:hypothetical protein
LLSRQAILEVHFRYHIPASPSVKSSRLNLALRVSPSSNLKQKWWAINLIFGIFFPLTCWVQPLWDGMLFTNSYSNGRFIYLIAQKKVIHICNSHWQTLPSTRHLHRSLHMASGKGVQVPTVWSVIVRHSCFQRLSIQQPLKRCCALRWHLVSPNSILINDPCSVYHIETYDLRITHFDSIALAFANLRLWFRFDWSQDAVELKSGWRHPSADVPNRPAPIINTYDASSPFSMKIFSGASSAGTVLLVQIFFIGYLTTLSDFQWVLAEDWHRKFCKGGAQVDLNASQTEYPVILSILRSWSVTSFSTKTPPLPC